MILEKLSVLVIVALNYFLNFSKTHHFYEKTFSNLETHFSKLFLNKFLYWKKICKDFIRFPMNPNLFTK